MSNPFESLNSWLVIGNNSRIVRVGLWFSVIKIANDGLPSSASTLNVAL